MHDPTCFDQQGLFIQEDWCLSNTVSREGLHCHGWGKQEPLVITRLSCLMADPRLLSLVLLGGASLQLLL